MATKRKPYYTITEAASALGITRAAVHEAIRTQRVAAEWGEIVQVTQGWRIPVKSLHAYQVSLSHQERGKKTLAA
jgi:hypothetical protein